MRGAASPSPRGGGLFFAGGRGGDGVCIADVCLWSPSPSVRPQRLSTAFASVGDTKSSKSSKLSFAGACAIIADDVDAVLGSDVSDIPLENPPIAGFPYAPGDALLLAAGCVGGDGSPNSAGDMSPINPCLVPSGDRTPNGSLARLSGNADEKSLKSSSSSSPSSDGGMTG